MEQAEVKVVASLDNSQFKAGLSRMSSQLSGLKGMIAGAFTVGAITSFAKSVLNTADELQNTSEALNVGVESLQALKAMAAESGVPFDQVAAALSRITKAQSEALTGSAPLKKAFAAFQISMSDLQGMSPDQIMQRIGAALKEGGRSAEEVAAVFDVMGKSSGSLMGMLESLGSQGLDATIQKFKELGMVMDAAAVKQLDAAGDAMERFKIQSVSVTGQALMGWNILFDTIAGVSTGLSLAEARMAAAQGLGMLGVGKKPGAGIGTEGDLKPTAEEDKWYKLMEEKTLGRMDLTAKIAYYEQEITALQKARVTANEINGRQMSDNLEIAAQILEIEKKRDALKKARTKQDYDESEKLDAMYRAEDDLAVETAKKRADILSGKSIDVPARARVGSLQAIGGLVGGVAGRGDQAARIAERQAKTQEAIQNLINETNGKLDELNRKLDGIISE